MNLLNDPIFTWGIKQISLLVTAFFGSFFISFITVGLLATFFFRRQKASKDFKKAQNRISLLIGILLFLALCKLLPHATPLKEESPLLGYFLLLLNYIAFVICLLLAGPLVDIFFTLLENVNKQTYGASKVVFQILRSIAKVTFFIMLAIILPYFFPIFSSYDIRHWLTSLTIGASTLTAIGALASKDLISNFFGALVIMFGKPFKIGDWIIINKLQGRVVNIDIRATKLQTKAGTMIYVPNAMFTNKDIVNYGQVSYQYVSLKVPLTSLSQEKLQQFITSLYQTIKDYPQLLEEQSHIQIANISQNEADLAFHLSFEKMTEIDAIQHVHAFLQKLQAIATKQGIAMT